MITPLVERIANAVLYEGYLLYPYRSSAIKNRQRFNFGIIYPLTYSEMNGGIEPCRMETQCLAAGDPLTALSVKVRCLRLVDRTVAALDHPASSLAASPAFTPVPVLNIDDRSYESWQEAAECEMELREFRFAELAGGTIRRHFQWPATRAVEPLHNSDGLIAGIIVRTQEPLDCSIEVSLHPLQDNLHRITVRIINNTPFEAVPAAGRDAVLAQSLLSAHTILHLREGDFLSMLEPRRQHQAATAACTNTGTWPVLAGEPGRRDTILSSPIILYDYPQIAPESPGDLFDGAEIDEILSLRILALTDAEKAAMRRSDELARRILERTEALPPEHFLKLHGTLREAR